jgi:hypothetical protein
MTSMNGLFISMNGLMPDKFMMLRMLVHQYKKGGWLYQPSALLNQFALV